MKALDVGCGVGGPMRTIACTSGAEITGITINQYQVQRGEHHNSKVRGTWTWPLGRPRLSAEALDCLI